MDIINEMIEFDWMASVTNKSARGGGGNSIHHQQHQQQQSHQHHHQHQTSSSPQTISCSSSASGSADNITSSGGGGGIDGRLPKTPFVAAMRTLFDIMADQSTGFVRLSDIEKRWQEGSAPRGVIESLRKWHYFWLFCMLLRLKVVLIWRAFDEVNVLLSWSV